MAVKLEPSLRDIELALTALWTKRAERENFLAGQPSALIHPALIKHIDQRGVKLYASLIELGRQDLMLSIYPYCKKVLSKHFTGLVQDYMESMPPDHFNLNQAARKFPEYLSVHAEAHLKRHPFIAELADYEWIELAVIEAEAEVSASVATEDSVLESENSEELDLKAFAASVPRLNPTACLRAYKYPIAQIVDLLEEDEKLPRRQKIQSSWLVAFRSAEHACEYLDISEMTFDLLQALQSRPQTSYGELIAIACNYSNNVEETIVDFLTMVEEFKKVGLFL